MFTTEDVQLFRTYVKRKSENKHDVTFVYVTLKNKTNELLNGDIS